MEYPVRSYDQLFNSFNKMNDNLVIDFVVLYNVNKPSDSQIELNTIDLTYQDFLNIFYSTNGGGFAINPNAKYYNILQLNNLYYTSNNHQMKWNLKHQLIKTFSKKNNVPESSLSPITSIKLDRESFALNSLSLHNKFQVALSLDEILHSLKDTMNVKTELDNSNSVEVKVRLHYVYFSDMLDTTISFILPFRVKFPKLILNSSNENFDKSFEPARAYMGLDSIKKSNTNIPIQKENPEQKIEFYEDDDTIQTLGTKNAQLDLKNLISNQKNFIIYFVFNWCFYLNNII